MALKLAKDGDVWAGKRMELNLSFENLQTYQWERLSKAIWSHAEMTGPLEERYIPGQKEPSGAAARIPEPTDTFTEFGVLQITPDVRVGVEVLTTRSLFECLSLTIPLAMFEPLTAEDQQTLETYLKQMALALFEVTAFSIAAIGIDRGCQLLLEMMTNPKVLRALTTTGNFLATDETLGALRLSFRSYAEVKPHLRWSPSKAT